MVLKKQSDGIRKEGANTNVHNHFMYLLNIINIILRLAEISNISSETTHVVSKSWSLNTCD